MDFGFNPLKIKIPSAQPVAFISNLPGGPLPPVQKPVQSKHQTPNTQSKQNRLCTLVLQILSPGIQAPHKFKLYNHQLSATNPHLNFHAKEFTATSGSHHSIPPLRCLCSCCPCLSRCFHRPCFHVSLCDLLGKRMAGSLPSKWILSDRPQKHPQDPNRIKSQRS